MALRRLARALRGDGSAGISSSSSSTSAVATSAAGTGIGTTSSSSLATAFGASRRSRTFCDSLSSSPTMRAVPFCTVMLRDPEPHALGPQPGHVEQRGRGRRRRAVAVGPLGARRRRRRSASSTAASRR